MRDDSAAAPDHGTDDWARGLLLAAADTIEVRPEPRPFVPLPSPRRPWAYAAAAAACVVAIVGVVAMLGGGDRPAPPIAREDALAADQIPSVFGYDSASARALLESKGLVVTVRELPTCAPADRALRTSPAVGSRFERGDRVQLEVQNDDSTRCPPPSRPDVWPFLDFANGRGPAPEFAPEVTLTVNGVSTTVTDEEAADPASWPACDAAVRDCPGSALDVVRDESARVQPLADGSWETPRLSVRGDAETERLSIGFLTEGQSGEWHVTLHWQPLNSRPVSLLTAVELTWPDTQGAVDSAAGEGPF